MVITWNSTRLSGWGRSRWAEVKAARPERMRELLDAWSAPDDRGVIPRGAGRSYGDQALNNDGLVIVSERLDRVLDFDPATGRIVVEPGVTFADLMRDFLPRGYLVPVSPGTAFSTVGGAVANDVHGKNHDAAGSFGDHLQWIEVLLPSGKLQKTSPKKNKALFEATIGGLGLTGMIVALCFDLVPVKSNAVHRKEIKIKSLQDFLQNFSELDHQTWRYSVGWIDALASGASLGRGILEVAKPAEAPVNMAVKAGRKVPIDLPSFALNRLSVRAFNEAYYRRIPDHGRETAVPYERFFYPLDAIQQWNRIYGKGGFYQFQCVLPPAECEAGLPKLLQQISQAGAASFLSVIKTLGGEGRGYLSFPMKGVTLALDIPIRAGTEPLMRELEATTRDHGGRIYLAKDSCLSAEGFATMYPKLPQFQKALEKIDPGGRMNSDMARRLKIREPRDE